MKRKCLSFGFTNIVDILGITLLTSALLAIVEDVPKSALKLEVPSQEIVGPSVRYLTITFVSFYVGIDILFSCDF